MGKKKQKAPVTPELILISDPNSDVDDLVSFVMAAVLADKGYFKLGGVVATGGEMMTRLRRAMFSKGCFIELGYPFLKVAVGADYPRRNGDADNFYLSHPLSEAVERKGVVVERNVLRLFHSCVNVAEDKSLTIVANAQMSDVAAYLREAGAKNLKKFARIIVMGAYAPRENDENPAVPDSSSYNNAVCMQGAEELYRVAQEKGVRLMFVPKDVIYQMQLGREFYDRLEKLSSPLAKLIAAANKLCLENLWNAVRRGDYSHFDIHRFAKVFMGKDYKISNRVISGRESFEEIWPKIRYFNLYDVVTVMGAADALFRQYGRFRRTSEKYMIYEAELSDPEGLKQALSDLIVEKLTPFRVSL